MCLSVYLMCVLSHITAFFLTHCTVEICSCVCPISTKWASPGRAPGFTSFSAFAGKDQLCPFFLLALTQVDLASDLLCGLFLILRPEDLLLVCCGLTLSTLLSLEGLRGEIGKEGVLGRGSSTCKTLETQRLVLWGLSLQGKYCMWEVG